MENFRGKDLILIRGLPGSGKSTLARRILAGAPATLRGKSFTTQHIEFDDYFMDDKGVFVWDISKVKEAHDSCLDRTATAMSKETNLIIIANNFLKQSHMTPYYQLASGMRYDVTVYTCDTVRPNIHNVPTATIRRMRSELEVPTIAIGD